MIFVIFLPFVSILAFLKQLRMVKNEVVKLCNEKEKTVIRGNKYKMPAMKWIGNLNHTYLNNTNEIFIHSI